jgi:hypothetical protein
MKTFREYLDIAIVSNNKTLQAKCKKVINAHLNEKDFFAGNFTFYPKTKIFRCLATIDKTTVKIVYGLNFGLRILFFQPNSQVNTQNLFKEFNTLLNTNLIN